MAAKFPVRAIIVQHQPKFNFIYRSGKSHDRYNPTIRKFPFGKQIRATPNDKVRQAALGDAADIMDSEDARVDGR